MQTIQWRPEVNAMTNPPSWRILAVPRRSAGIEDIADDIALRHPNFSKADILTILRAEDEAVQARLLNGEQVTKEGSWSWFVSFSGRLNHPTDPLPPIDQCLNVNVRISPPFTRAIRQSARTERLPVREKKPVISTARDAVLDLDNVLNPDGMLRLGGRNLDFDPKQPDSQCLIQGTESGSAIQSRFGRIENSSIILIPDIPAQSQPWNNEYTVSVSTHYSEHGTLRTGTCRQMLRSPLTISGLGLPDPPEHGILTGNAASPYISVIGGTVTADEMLRIQVILDHRKKVLLLSLLDMEKKGRTGTAVSVRENGEYTLQGFTDSAVSSLSIRVNDYAALQEMVRNSYSGRLVDVLDIQL
ncbi:MAG: hypothetical protein D3911_11020 [Candidatus Electrothrix sp. AW3_4]|nr:hypothetical protein [Candidatus Electrothrix gigas]